MRALLVGNVNAGRIRGEGGLARLEQRLRGEGLEVRRVVHQGSHDAASALRHALQEESPERTRVIVAGGDGTINAALPALMGTAFPLAILPLGSVNVLARELGLPRDAEKAIALTAGGCLRRIDLGLANGRPFSLMAGIGFDAAVVRSVGRRAKGRIGSFAYVARGLGALLRYPASRFRVTADGTEFEVKAWLAVVANAARYTYSWRLSPLASLGDGWLDVCLFQGSSLVQMAKQAAAALRGRHSGCEGVLQLRARRLHFECDPPAFLQVDGDAVGATPVKIGIVPKALTVVVPRD